nr:hypothetical protein [uncultured Chryseobacterium sp.]
MSNIIRTQVFLLRIIQWKAKNGMKILRISLGLIFFWFGFIKFFPDLSVAEVIASKTISYISRGFIDKSVSMPILAIWECIIGLGLLSGKKTKFILLLLYLQMGGTLVPLFAFPDETWTSHFMVPTLLGQYIIKNVVLISAGIVIGATSNGGILISDPTIAMKALHLQEVYDRYKQRFNKDPHR